MKIEQQIINVIFDADRGSVSVASREATVGEPLGTLPQPARRGYRFVGWYLDGEPVTAETRLTSEEDVRLVARWEKKKRSRKPSMLRRQKAAIVALAVLCLLLVGTLLVVNEVIHIYAVKDEFVLDGQVQSETYYVRRRGGTYALYDRAGNPMEQNSDGYYIVASGNQYKLDAETGECELYAVVDTEGSELLAFQDRIMIFPQIKQDNVYSIEVDSSEHAPYRFYRDASGTVRIEGMEEAPISYNKELFASLCVSCGYPLTSRRLNTTGADSTVPRLENGEVDYDAFGLVERYDENGEVTYRPTVYTITRAKYAEDGTCLPDESTRYTVRIGDRTLPGGGYYAQLEGRDSIYILGYTLQDTVLQPIEALVTPQVFYPLSINTFLRAEGFLLGTVDLSQISDPDNLKIEPLVAFSYLDMQARTNSMYTSKPFLVQTKLMEGYDLDDTNVSTMLDLISTMEFVSCRKLGLTPEAMNEYGFNTDAFCMVFDSPVLDDKGKITGYVENTVLISKKTPDGTYYMASFLYDMIVEVDQHYLSFLEWELSDWYMPNLYTHSIYTLTDIKFNVLGKEYSLRLDNSYSYMFYESSTGTMSRIDPTTGSLSTDASGALVYTDAAGARHNVKAFDLTKGDYYFKIIDLEDGKNTVTYERFRNYRFTVDRNGSQTLTIVRDDKSEVDYTLTYQNGSTQKRAKAYSLIYRDADGDEYAVLGKYNTDASTSKVVTDYYQLPYWKETATKDANGNTVYKWTRVTLTNQSTALLFRDEGNRLYEIDLRTDNLRIFCDQYTGGKVDPHLLDYTVIHTYTTDKGLEKTEVISALDNFRQFYNNLVTYTIEGDVDEETFIANMGMTPDEYIKTHDPDATITYHVGDYAANANLFTQPMTEDETSPETRYWTENNERDVIIRFYRYSERKSMVTIEVATYDEQGNPVFDPEKTVGRFYVLTDFLEALTDDLDTLLAGKRIEERY